MIEVNPLALEQAAELDAERKRTGKRSWLHGIPIMLKDNIATVASEGQSLIWPGFSRALIRVVVPPGMNTTAGSHALVGSIVPGDATVAAKLRQAGAILLGKTNMVSDVSYSAYCSL